MRSGFKMKGYSYPGKSPVKQKVDPDAPGTPGTPGYEPKVKSMDYLTKTPVGPRAAKGDDDQSKELARSRYEMGEYKNDPTGQANFKPAYEGADYSKKDIAKMNSKQKKDIE